MQLRFLVVEEVFRLLTAATTRVENAQRLVTDAMEMIQPGTASTKKVPILRVSRPEVRGHITFAASKSRTRAHLTVGGHRIAVAQQQRAKRRRMTVRLRTALTFEVEFAVCRASC